MNVYVTKINDDKKNKIIKYIDSPFIEFKNATSKVSLTVSDLTNGLSLNSEGEGFTLGIGVKKSDGTIGYTGPGHISAAANKNAYYGTTYIGMVRTKVFSGSTDISFISKEGTTYQPCKKLNGTTLVGGTFTGDVYTSVNTIAAYPQGAQVYEWGGTSNKQGGTIISGDVSVNADGTILTHQVQCNYKAIHGDSGAPIGYLSSSNQYSIIGFQSSSSGLDANGNWVYGTSNSFFSKASNCLSSLGVTPYPN